jgi:hypothetical protein
MVAASISWISTLIENKMPNAPRGASNLLAPSIKNLIDGVYSLGEFAVKLDDLYPRIGSLRLGLGEHFDGRVPAFEKVAGAIVEAGRGHEIDGLALAFFANLIMPGSLGHTKLLSRRLEAYPSILIWYGLFAALSPDFDYRALFSGLGLKLVRDLETDFDLSEKPIADISLDELYIVSRIGLKSRIIKPVQTRSVLVSLLPGIDVFARFAGANDPYQKSYDVRADSNERMDTGFAERDRQIARLLLQAQRLLSDAGTLTRETSSHPRRTQKTRGPGRI